MTGHIDGDARRVQSARITSSPNRHYGFLRGFAIQLAGFVANERIPVYLNFGSRSVVNELTQLRREPEIRLGLRSGH
jgi:hypothetical protein